MEKKFSWSRSCLCWSRRRLPDADEDRLCQYVPIILKKFIEQLLAERELAYT